MTKILSMTRSIIGRTESEKHAQLVCEYLNERFVKCGAIAEHNEVDNLFLILTKYSKDLNDATLRVETCRAFLHALKN